MPTNGQCFLFWDKRDHSEKVQNKLLVLTGPQHVLQLNRHGGIGVGALPLLTCSPQEEMCTR